MTQIDLQNVKSKLATYITKYPNKNNTKLALLFLKENDDIELSLRSIRRYISLVKVANIGLDEDSDTDTGTDIDVSTTDVVSIVQNTEDEDKDEYEKTIDDIYADLLDVEDTVSTLTLSTKNHSYLFDYNTIDQIYCAYSRQGLNLSFGVIQQILELPFVELRLILSKLHITKECNPYSDHSKDTMSEVELFENLSANVEILLDKVQQHDGTTTTKLNKLYKKNLILQQNQDLKLRSYVEELKDYLPTVKIINKNKINKLADLSNRVHLFIPDMHIGLHQDNYNIDIIKEKLDDIVGTINTYDERVHVHFMGDIIHSVSGLNHRDTWKNMKQGTTGAEAIIQPFELLLNFLNKIKNLYKINFVGGNHSRLASNAAEENTAEAEKLIAYMLRKSIGVRYNERDLVSINFDSYRIVDDEDPNITIILLHGDKPIDKASGQSIAWEYGNSSKFNYIAVAHMHSRKQNPKDDGLRFRKEQLPAFCPADTYAKTVAHESLPGYKIVKASSNKVPIVLDIPLYYE